MLVVEPDAAPPVAPPAPVAEELPARPGATWRDKVLGRGVWSATWPKLAAIALAVGIWQVVVWSGWKREYVLPAPGTVFRRLGELVADGTVLEALAVTGRRAALGFGVALAVGVVLGAIVASSRIARAAVGSMITGLQTMPSIAWFPLAIILFGLSEEGILFVVVLGAAPSVANGLITGIDHVPPILLRAGQVMGAQGWSRFRHVVLPASMPSFVGGLKQGWAFAWRSLMAGELLVTLGVAGVGFLLQQYRSEYDTPGLIAIMIVILVVGIVVDAACFGTLDRFVRRRHGLVDDS